VSLSERALRCYERVGADHALAATRARVELGLSLDRTGDDGAAREQLQVAVNDAIELGDPELEALALAHLARLAMSAGDWPAATDLLDAAAPLAEKAGGALLAEVLLGRAWMIEATDGPAAAVEPTQRALELSRAIGDPELELRALNQLSICAGRLDDLELATAHTDAALALARRIGNNLREATLLNTQGALAHLSATLDGTGDLSLAIDLYRQSAELSGELGYSIGETNALINVAQASVEAGRLDDGRAHATRCLETAWQRGRYPDAGFAVLVLAQATIADGDVATGLAMIGTVLADPRTDDEDDEVARILGTLGIDEAQAELHMSVGRARALDDLVPQLIADEVAQVG
jgi:tetratricopeptide (TPR) repeat protein